MGFSLDFLLPTFIGKYKDNIINPLRDVDTRMASKRKGKQYIYLERAKQFSLIFCLVSNSFQQTPIKVEEGRQLIW